MAGQLEIAFNARPRGALTVTQLVRRVRAALEANLGEQWVAGEVSNARTAPSGHLYFTLKDAESAINVVMFRSALRRVSFRVVDGIEVLVCGRVNLYEARGALQLYAEELEPRGLGALQLAFAQLRQRLSEEGLFDPARKRALPLFPRAVGIVTARHGAGLHDILTIIRRRFPNTHLIIRPARVQGDGAAADIAQAIDDLNRDGRAEVMIVGRGGGSLEDLWAFNEEAVARAIHRSRIPVVSAVGHEIDYTIADFVADARAPTPTAAAAMVVADKAALRQSLREAAATLRGALAGVLEERRRRTAELRTRLREPGNLMRQARQRVDEGAAELETAWRRRVRESARRVRENGVRLRGPLALMREGGARLLAARRGLFAARAAALESRRARLAALAARLDSLSPLRVLERGYAVVTDPRDGRALTDAGRIEVGDELDVRLHRGRLRARATARDTRQS